jgi:hypothetical protein
MIDSKEDTSMIQNTGDKRRTRAGVAITLIAAISGIAAIAGFLWLSHANAGNRTEDALSTSKANTSALRAMAKVKQSIESNNQLAKSLKDNGDHELPSSLNFSSAEDYRQSAHWFDHAERSRDDKFVARSTPLIFDASCKTYKESRHANFETAIAREVEFDPTQATPADVQLQELAQFWRLGDTFYKLAGTWERDQPATYRVKLFAASSADFENNLRVMPLPEELPAQTDAITLGEAIDREVERAVAAGGTRGARLAQVFYPSASGAQTLEVRLHNGRPVSWMFGHGRCQLREAGDAYCRCIAPDSNEKNHTHDQQSAGPSQKQAKEKQYRVHD